MPGSPGAVVVLGSGQTRAEQYFHTIYVRLAPQVLHQKTTLCGSVGMAYGCAWTCHCLSLSSCVDWGLGGVERFESPVVVVLVGFGVVSILV